MQVSTNYYSPQEYLELEEQAQQRHEYLDGQIIPMAGGTNHNKIALNLSSNLNFALRGSSYDVFMSDLRLWIPDYRLYTYMPKTDRLQLLISWRSQKSYLTLRKNTTVGINLECIVLFLVLKNTC